MHTTYRHMGSQLSLRRDTCVWNAFCSSSRTRAVGLAAVDGQTGGGCGS
jgi:hypothetical protein